MSNRKHHLISLKIMLLYIQLVSPSVILSTPPKVKCVVCCTTCQQSEPIGEQ